MDVSSVPRARYPSRLGGGAGSVRDLSPNGLIHGVAPRDGAAVLLPHQSRGSPVRWSETGRTGPVPERRGGWQFEV